MNTIGFVISGKENEKRRALIPKDILKIKNREMLFFECGYGKILGFSDIEYQQTGANICPKLETYSQNIICNVKAPEQDEYDFYKKGQTLFGWAHAVQGKLIVNFILSKKMTCIAWEDMIESGRYCFWRNREISGEAAVIHALTFFGRLPNQCKVAIIGRGNCARGAFKVFSSLGSEIVVYDRINVPFLRNELAQFDIIVNAVLWDVFRTDHLIYRSDLKMMKPGSMIIDVSCDESMGIESSHPTSISDPIYVIDNVIHYAVDHTPALFYKTASEVISNALYPYIDFLIEGTRNPVLEKATCIKDGVILDKKIVQFQKR